MAIDINDFLEGLDPSVLSEISGAQLLQLIRNATPSASRALVINDDATPDVGTYPRYTRYFWTRPSEFNRIVRTWDSSQNDWIAINPQNNTIGTDQIQDGAVTLPKLYNPNDVTKAFWLIRVNAAGNGFELWPLSTSTGAIDIQSIIKGANNTFPHIKADGSAWEFILADDIAALFGSGALVSSQMRAQNGVAGTMIYHSGPFNRYIELPPGTNGQILGIAAGLPAWMDGNITPVTGKSNPPNQSLPVGIGALTFNHGLGSMPTIATTRLVCTTGDGDYAAGDEVPIESCYFDNGTGIQFPVSVVIGPIDINVCFTASSVLAILRKDGTAPLAITRASWQCKVIAFI